MAVRQQPVCDGAAEQAGCADDEDHGTSDVW
jgi:hypothetical protein